MTVTTERAALFRQRVQEAERKADGASSEESRRAWLIVARDWGRMAAKEELKLLSEQEASETTLVPDDDEPPSQA